MEGVQSPSPDLGPPATVPPDKRASMDLSPTGSPTAASLELCSRASFAPGKRNWGRISSGSGAIAKARMTTQARITKMGETGLPAVCLLGGNLLSWVFKCVNKVG